MRCVESTVVALRGGGAIGQWGGCAKIRPVMALPSIQHISLVAITIASLLLLVACVVPMPGGGVLFALLAAAFPVAMCTIGAARRGRLGPLAWPLAVLLVIYVACVATMLALRGRVLDGPWLGGLPLAATLELWGLFLLPMFFVAVVYGLTFHREELDPPKAAASRTESKGA